MGNEFEKSPKHHRLASIRSLRGGMRLIASLSVLLFVGCIETTLVEKREDFR